MFLFIIIIIIIFGNQQSDLSPTSSIGHHNPIATHPTIHHGHDEPPPLALHRHSHSSPKRPNKKLTTTQEQIHGKITITIPTTTKTHSYFTNARTNPQTAKNKQK
jgi:hypothetical protein